MKIEVQGKLPIGVTAKDIILSIIGKIGTAGGTGFVIEYTGEVIAIYHGRENDSLQYVNRSWRKSWYNGTR